MDDYALALSAFRDGPDEALEQAAKGLLNQLDGYASNHPRNEQLAVDRSLEPWGSHDSSGPPHTCRPARQHSASARGQDKENARCASPVAHHPIINERSRQLTAERTAGRGAIEDRLLEAGRERIERRQRASAEADLEREQADQTGRRGAPEINDVSAELMRERAGDCANRLYASAKTAAERQAAQRMHEEAMARTLASQLPLSDVTRRIAAELPGRDAPISERLYAEGLERLALARSAVPVDAEDPHQPTINEQSRALAHRAYERIGADASAPVYERLGARNSMRESQLSATPMEASHMPEINLNSERMAMRATDRSLPVEERLLARAHTAPKFEEPDHRPKVNPESERILNAKGPMLPLEVRLREPVGRVRESTLASLAPATHAPELSEGSRKLLASRAHDGKSAADRLIAWGASRVRPSPDPTLADRRYSFGYDPTEERSEMERREAERRKELARLAREAARRRSAEKRVEAEKSRRQEAAERYQGEPPPLDLEGLKTLTTISEPSIKAALDTGPPTPSAATDALESSPMPDEPVLQSPCKTPPSPRPSPPSASPQPSQGGARQAPSRAPPASSMSRARRQSAVPSCPPRQIAAPRPPRRASTGYDVPQHAAKQARPSPSRPLTRQGIRLGQETSTRLRCSQLHVSQPPASRLPAPGTRQLRLAIGGGRPSSPQDSSTREKQYQAFGGKDSSSQAAAMSTFKQPDLPGTPPVSDTLALADGSFSLSADTAVSLLEADESTTVTAPRARDESPACVCVSSKIFAHPPAHGSVGAARREGSGECTERHAPSTDRHEFSRSPPRPGLPTPQSFASYDVLLDGSELTKPRPFISAEVLGKNVEPSLAPMAITSFANTSPRCSARSSVTRACADPVEPLQPTQTARLAVSHEDANILCDSTDEPVPRDQLPTPSVAPAPQTSGPSALSREVEGHTRIRAQTSSQITSTPGAVLDLTSACRSVPCPSPSSSPQRRGTLEAPSTPRAKSRPSSSVDDTDSATTLSPERRSMVAKDDDGWVGRHGTTSREQPSPEQIQDQLAIWAAQFEAEMVKGTCASSDMAIDSVTRSKRAVGTILGSHSPPPQAKAEPSSGSFDAPVADAVHKSKAQRKLSANTVLAGSVIVAKDKEDVEIRRSLEDVGNVGERCGAVLEDYKEPRLSLEGIESAEVQRLTSKLKLAQAEAAELPRAREDLRMAQVQLAELKRVAEEHHLARTEAEEGIKPVKEKLSLALGELDKVKDELRLARLASEELIQVKEALRQAQARAAEIERAKEAATSLTIEAEEVARMKEELRRARLQSVELDRIKDELSVAQANAAELARTKEELRRIRANAVSIEELHEELELSQAEARRAASRARRAIEAAEDAEARLEAQLRERDRDVARLLSQRDEAVQAAAEARHEAAILRAAALTDANRAAVRSQTPNLGAPGALRQAWQSLSTSQETLQTDTDPIRRSGATIEDASISESASRVLAVPSPHEPRGDASTSSYSTVHIRGRWEKEIEAAQQEMARLSRELQRSQEEQLGASLRARRKERELRELKAANPNADTTGLDQRSAQEAEHVSC